jgi:hypothetical protein
MTTKRILPADVYDTLELMALAYGGIGAGMDFRISNGRLFPLCVFGLARDAAQVDPSFPSSASELTIALGNAGITRRTNDFAVYAINDHTSSRVPFEAWCEKLNVERGE